MILSVDIPKEISEKLNRMNQTNKSRFLSEIKTNIFSIYSNKLNNIYVSGSFTSMNHNTPSLEDMLYAMKILRNDSEEVVLFVDEDAFETTASPLKINNLENNLFVPMQEIAVVKQDEYRDKFSRLCDDVERGINNYISRDFKKKIEKTGGALNGRF